MPSGSEAWLERQLLAGPGQPGAISTTCPVPFRCLSGSSAGPSALAEAARIRSSTVTSALTALWDSCPYWARILLEAPERQLGSIRLPQAGLTHTEHVVAAHAESSPPAGPRARVANRDGGPLARAFIADAGTLRSLVCERRTSAGPAPDS